MAGGSARRSSGLGLVADLKVRTTLADLKVRTALAACLLWTLAFIWPSAGDTAIAQASPPPPSGAVSFQTASECMACHNSLTTSGGEDVSIGVSWRASMMAHSSRDPYWLAAVRRETVDHPKHAAAIEDECSICHMPMTTYPARAAGRLGRVFEHLASRDRGGAPNAFAADGVSCTVCHQITAERLGTPESFTGGYVLNVTQPRQAALMFGPFQMDEGRSHVMRSATGVEPAEGLHVRQSELCATCHTLFTQPLDGDGRAIGRLPEQVPFLEWQHSAYRTSRSCQDCHMPPVEEPTPIASVVGELREGLGRHTFLGGNFFMLRMLNRYRQDLGVTAPSHELEASASATERQLQRNTATVTITEADEDRLEHHLHRCRGEPDRPQAADGIPVTSCVVARDGARSIRALRLRVGRHGANRRHCRQRPRRGRHSLRAALRGDSVDRPGADLRIGDGRRPGAPTTGLLRGVRYAKDNRLLPRGFNKETASADVAIHGGAVADADFGAGGDRVRYVLTLPDLQQPLTIQAELRFQTIGYRWAQNLGAYDAAETKRFLTFYEAMARGSSLVIAQASATID